MAATPNPYTCRHPSVDCPVSYTYTHSQHANIRIYSLPDPPSFSKHMHTHRCTHSNSKGQIHGLWSRQKVVNSCATRCATSQDSSKGWCTLSLFTCRDSRQNRSMCSLLHSSNLALLLSFVQGSSAHIEAYRDRRWRRGLVNNEWMQSSEVLSWGRFLREKWIARIACYLHFAIRVMSRGSGIVPCVWW